MGRVIAFLNIDDAKDVKDLASKAEIALTDIVGQFNGNIEFDKNIFSQTIDVTFPATADTELLVSHSLGVIPVGYIVCKKSVACDVYTGSSSWTDKNIYLKCNTANAVVKLIIRGS